MRKEIASDIKSMDNRLIPTRFEIIPADKPANRTIVILNEIRFNVPIQESFFTQQNMKQVK
jgi:outer membrane lipoprotein-sorting protein